MNVPVWSRYDLSELDCIYTQYVLFSLLGNLDPEIDEKYLYDTFSAFGVILQTPKIMRDPETGNSKGFAFINFASFDASDAAFDAMNGQFLCNRAIRVTYAFKKDGKGERHGSAAERLLAAKKPVIQDDRPHQQFADAPTNNVVEITPPIHDGANPLMSNNLVPRYPFPAPAHPSQLQHHPTGLPQMTPQGSYRPPLPVGPPSNMYGVGMPRQPMPQVPPSLMNPSFMPSHQPPRRAMHPDMQFQHLHNSNFREPLQMHHIPHQNFHQPHSVVGMPRMHSHGGMIPPPPPMSMPQHGGYPRPASPPQSSVSRLPPPPPMYTN